MGTGLTIDDLIDKLLVEDPSRSGMHIKSKKKSIYSNNK